MSKVTNLISIAALVITFSKPARAQIPLPISGQSIQLQELINKSESQLRALNEMLSHGKKNTAALEAAAATLHNMANGIGESIQKFQGTKTYDQALLTVQEEGIRANEALAEARAKASSKDDPEVMASARDRRFLQQATEANRADLAEQQKFNVALKSAEPGFVPKLQTQAQLGMWQTSTRSSAQLSELLQQLEALREEVHAGSQNKNAFADLIRGAELQNARQREVNPHGLR